MHVLLNIEFKKNVKLFLNNDVSMKGTPKRDIMHPNSPDPQMKA